MIYTYKNPFPKSKIECDFLVIGSGAGGSSCAYSLSKSSSSVVMIESGSFHLPKDFNQREEKMFPKLFYDAGARRTLDKSIRVLHGKGVGGSTLHNINLCKQMPKELMDHWGFKKFSHKNFKPFMNEIETLLSVKKINDENINLNNMILRKGVRKLGYKGGVLKHNRVGCVGSGFCELGCAFNAKMNGMKVFAPKIIENGGRIFANCRAVGLEYQGKRIVRVHCEVLSPDGQKVLKNITIYPKKVILSGGAIESPKLLLNSNIPDPKRLIGSDLHLHPGFVVSGVFEEDIESWSGIPQSFECTEFLSFNEKLNKRIWITTAAAHPGATASIIPGFGDEHYAMMKKYAKLAPLTVMLHDSSSGSLSSSGKNNIKIKYEISKKDIEQVKIGLKESARLLFMGGAKEVLIPLGSGIKLKNIENINSLNLEINKYQADVISVHQMSTLKMGVNKNKSLVDEYGKYHHMDNLYVSDTSVYPSSIGIPPQISTYSLGLYIASHIK
jgi:choline dehydrogenase-like flavoprotein